MRGACAKGAGLAVAALLALPVTAEAAYVTGVGPGFGAGDGTQSTGLATCDPGDIAIGGGVNVGTDNYADQVYLNTSRPEPDLNPIGDGWRVYVDNYPGGAANHLVNAWAMCDTKGTPDDYVIRTEAVNVPDGKERGGVAQCKEKEVVVGGGGRSSGFFAEETYLSSSAPVDDGDKDNRPDDGWAAELNNDEGGSLLDTLDVFAICDRTHKASGFSYESRTKRLKDAELRGIGAPCGSDALVGGGVSTAAKYKHGLYIDSTFPFASQNEWFAYVTNFETPDGDARKITATSICKR